MAQFSYVGSLDGDQHPVLKPFVIGASTALAVGDAVTLGSTHGIAVATAGAGHGILGIVHGFIYGTGLPVAPASGTAANTAVTTTQTGASNDTAAFLSPTKVYALVDMNPNSIYSCAVTSTGALAVTAGTVGTGCGIYGNLGTATSGAQVLSDTFALTGVNNQFFVISPDPDNVFSAGGSIIGATAYTPKVLVTIAARVAGPGIFAA